MNGGRKIRAYLVWGVSVIPCVISDEFSEKTAGLTSQPNASTFI